MARLKPPFVIVVEHDTPAYLQSTDPGFDDWISDADLALRFPSLPAAQIARDAAVDALRARHAREDQLQQLRIVPAADLARAGA